MPEGVVFDLGYAPHEGERLGRAGALRALYRDGLRKVLGLRRRARSKVFPWMLLAIAVLPALFFIAFGILAGTLAENLAEATFFSHSRYFEMTGVIGLIFVALASSELLVPDRVHGVMAVYASRPLSMADYLAGRAASLGTVVFAFMEIPHLVLFFGRAWVSDDGFGSYVVDNVSVLWETSLASLLYFVMYASLGFVVAAFASRPAIAAGVLVGVISISGPATDALVSTGTFRVAGLLALQHHPGYVKDWIMGDDVRTWIPEAAGFEPAVSLAIIAAVAAVSAVVVLRRYRRLR